MFEMPFGQKTCMGPKSVLDGECTMAPPGEYDEIICASAVIRTVAVITAATCY